MVWAQAAMHFIAGLSFYHRARELKPGRDVPGLILGLLVGEINNKERDLGGEGGGSGCVRVDVRVEV